MTGYMQISSGELSNTALYCCAYTIEKFLQWFVEITVVEINDKINQWFDIGERVLSQIKLIIPHQRHC